MCKCDIRAVNSIISVKTGTDKDMINTKGGNSKYVTHSVEAESKFYLNFFLYLET